MPGQLKKIAVFFGGLSPEHDVSIITGLQVMSALDRALYEVIPVYIARDGRWWTGEALFERASYLPNEAIYQKLQPVALDVTMRKKPQLNIGGQNWLKRSLNQPAKIEFDVALPAFHGAIGEDGQIQGLFETANVPYTGMRTLASSVLMDKVITKHVFAGANIPLLPYRELRKPAEGLILTEEELAAQIGDFGFPCCVKPSHMGSSIGVARVENISELAEVLPSIFRYDIAAILEPFVENMVEYNASVARINGKVQISAIEKPKRTQDLLDFKEKYMAGDGGKSGGAKTGGAKMGGAKSGAKTERVSEGMLSLTRELNPELPGDMAGRIEQWSIKAFELIGGTGAPRIDFISNEASGEVWLNEINPCPGSYGYFLWEARKDPVLFSELMDMLIDEAMDCADALEGGDDPTPKDARLFTRRG